MGRKSPKTSEKISIPLIRYGIPLSVMGLLLKEGIDIDLIRTAIIALITISILIIFIRRIPLLKNQFYPNYSLILGGLIGNTSFLGFPIALALLPENTINFTVGFDLGTTLFAWIFGPYLLQKNDVNYSLINFTKIFSLILNSPASRGVIGVLIVYLLGFQDKLGKIIFIPTLGVIAIAVIVVGTRLGIIFNQKTQIFNFEKGIKYAFLLKLFIFPLFIYIICKFFNLNSIETKAIVLQAGTPTAISTILMAEAYKTNQDIAAKILFTTTIFSFLTIPIINLIIQ